MPGRALHYELRPGGCAQGTGHQPSVVCPAVLFDTSYDRVIVSDTRIDDLGPASATDTRHVPVSRTKSIFSRNGLPPAPPRKIGPKKPSIHIGVTLVPPAAAKFTPKVAVDLN